MDDSKVPVVINVKAFETMVDNLKIIVHNLGLVEKNFKNRDLYQEAYLLQKNKQYLINMEFNMTLLLNQLEANKLLAQSIQN